MNNEGIRRVIVVSKTHLDVGFTDYAENVLRRYTEDFIPRSVELAFRLNRDGRRSFVWTTGAYLIDYALKHSTPENAARLSEALQKGYVAYHGLPLTTHTELMSAELVRYGLSIAGRLDEQYGGQTIAAKMTDVPGHTKALVPLLADAGIRYLHIGVNAASRVPKVPELFRWRYAGQEIAVSYSGDYASPILLENGAALEMLHTHDNFGPPSEEEIADFYEQMRKTYPGAEISAGTLNDFAREIEAVWDTLPVVEEEIGDTWIHGAASDPQKTADCKRLLAMADRWVETGELQRGTPAYEGLMENLLLVCEHTWGMDVKKHLLDFRSWSKKDFAAARKADITRYEDYGRNNAAIFEGMRAELDTYRGENKTSSYSIFEESHKEQRGYIRKGLAALPEELRRRAEGALAFSFPERDPEAAQIEPMKPVSAGRWTAVWDHCGALVRLKNDDIGTDRTVELGRFFYQSFDGETVDRAYHEYGRDLDKNFAWAACDFNKPGLAEEPSVKNGLWQGTVTAMEQRGDTVTVFLQGDEAAAKQYGCPRELALVYAFGDRGITLTLYWRKKDAIRSPEALWLGFALPVSDPADLRFVKLGREIDPRAVISGGNRKLHAIERAVCRSGTESFVLTPKDAPVVSVGGRHLYDTDDRPEDPNNGLYFLLCNNRWGTNFPQWYEDDGRFTFEMTF